MDERLAEIRHRLVMEEVCGKATNVAGFLEMEEELLGEAAELERMLAAEEGGSHDLCKAHRKESKGTRI